MTFHYEAIRVTCRTENQRVEEENSKLIRKTGRTLNFHSNNIIFCMRLYRILSQRLL